MDIFAYSFLQRALVVGLVTALICPLVGMFMVLRRQSLLGDGLGHIAFAGVTGASLVGIYPAVGAAIFTVAAALGIESVRRNHREYSDVSLALFFYGGLALAVVFSSLGRLSSMGLMGFLFGSILTVTWFDIIGITLIGLIVALILWWLWPSLLLSSFDEDVARVNGIPTEKINLLFAVLVACVVVVGMTVVGILLISALMIVPVATAHLWQRGFKTTTILSIVYSLAMVCLGLIGAYIFDLASGGVVVLTGIILYFMTFILKKWLK